MKIEHTEDVAKLRQAEYPPIEDLADAMYWNSKGDASKLEAYFARVLAVKEKYPK